VVPVLFDKNFLPLFGESFAALILLWRMCFAMALKVAPAVEYAGVLELQSSRCRVRTHDGRIEIYQVAVVRARALDRADAVSIVTCRAGNLLLQVFGVPCKAFIV
jgi:hypothetical protein